MSASPAVPVIVSVLVLALVCGAQTPPPPSSEKSPESADVTFQSGVSNVRIDVQVTEAEGQLITGLQQQDFAVFDEGRQQPILYFGREAEPLSLLLLLDVSGSTRQFIDQIANVARDSLRYLNRRDKVAIMLFARRSRVMLPWTDDQTVVAGELRKAAVNQDLGAGTNINDALLAAVKYVDESAGETGRRAILILTDNLGLNYKSPDPPVIEALYGADTVLNAIVVGKGQRPEPVSGNTYQNPDFTSPDVFRISEETGGEALRAERAAGPTFARLIERIRTRYSLHYNKPQSAIPGSFRKVEVMLSPDARQRYPQAVLRYRRGYRVR